MADAPVQFSLNDAQDQVFSLNSPDAPLPPSPSTADDRSGKLHYALGDQSPGQEAIRTQLLAGQEPTLRKQIAGADDYQLLLDKQNYLSHIAQSGVQLSPQQFDLVQRMSAQDFRTNPNVIFESKFAAKTANDLYSATLPATQPVSAPDDEAFRSTVTFQQYVQKKLQDENDRWDNEGIVEKGKNFLAQFIPILPWYRQAQALQDRPTHFENWGMGETQADNVMYMYKLPLDQRIKILDRALDHLHSNASPIDTMTFLQSLLSFSTSDRFLANSMSIADYTTLGAPVAKVLARGLKLGAAAADIGKAAETAAEVKQITSPSKVPQIEYQGSNKFRTQGELFPQPEQPDLFENTFGNRGPVQTKPLAESNFPPGQQRAAHTSDFSTYEGEGGQYQLPNGGDQVIPGAMVRGSRGFVGQQPFVEGPTRGQGGQFLRRTRLPTTAMQQGELDLTQPEHQLGFDFPYIREVPKEPPAQGNLFEGTPHEPGTPPPNEGVRQQRQILADATKVMDGPTVPKVEDVLSAIGNTHDSAFVSAIKRLTDGSPNGIATLAEQIKTLIDPENWLRGSKVLGRTAVPTMGAELRKVSDQLLGQFFGETPGSGMAKVNRLTPEAAAIARRNAEAQLSRDFSKLNAHVLSIRYTPAEMTDTNAGHVSWLVGKPGKQLFERVDQAQLYQHEIYELGDQAIVRSQGKGYVLELSQPLDEYSPDVIKALSTPLNNSPTRLGNIIGRWLRTSKDLLGPMQNQNRNIATHAQQQIALSMKNVAEKYIGSLPKKARREVAEMLEYNRDMPREEGGERGFWYRNAAEFESAFLNRHGHMPTKEQVIAYDTYHRLQDFELAMEKTFVLRDKLRMGMRQHRFLYVDENGAQQRSPWFEGSSLDKFPWSLGNKVDQDAGVWFYDSQTKKGRFFYKFDVQDTKERQEIDKLVQDHGFRVIRLGDPKAHPLEAIAKTKAGSDVKDVIHYVITDGWEHQPLSYADQVKYREGPHSIYKHNWYGSQPVIQQGRNGRWTYLGDNNFFNAKTQAQAQKYADMAEEGRKLLKQSDMNGLRAHISKTPWTMDEFLDLFRRNDSPLSLDHPIVVKERGHNTIDTNPVLKDMYTNLVDGTKNMHDPTNIMDRSFLMDRDELINTVNEKTWSMAPAAQLDPYTALSQVVGQRLRNGWTNDYKVGAVHQWIAQFQHVMDAPENQLLGHPLYFLFNPKWKNVSAAARADQIAAKAARLAIINFVGAKSDFARDMDAFKMRLLNSVYNVAGDGKLLDSALSVSTDPVHWLRSVAFHSKLGFFNPIQFFLQANQMYHAIAVSGVKNGISGVSAAFLMRRLGTNASEEVLNRVASIASKFGWTENEFKDMYAAFKRTGLHQVAGEAVLRDDAFDPHLFRTKLGGFMLDSGSMFFNEGDRLGRLTGFATAYKDFRGGRATADGFRGSEKITNRELGWIMNREDDLSGNMTVASKAAWQNGLWSVPTQFMAWNARMMEQFMPGVTRLTGAEKLRALAAYSALYGAPLGLGVTVGGVWPVYDSIKEEAMARGINLDEGWFEPLTEGLVGWGTHMVTGRQYNASPRFAPGNSTAIRDILRGDKSFTEAMFGASGSIVGDILRSSYPFQYYLASVFQDNGEFPITPADWINTARIFKTADIAAQVGFIMAYGKWITKTGTVVDDKENGMDAIAVMFGLTPQRVADTFLGMDAQKQIEANRKGYQQQIMQSLRKAYQAGENGDYEGMRKGFIQARTISEASQMPPQEVEKAYEQAEKELYTLKEKIDWDAVQKASPDRYNDKLNQYLRNH